MFLVNSNDSIPLYKQLYNQIRENILSGRLAADSKLPSIRDLSNELAISRNTVDGAYQELYAEGYIYSKPRSGYYVSELDQESAPRSLTRHPIKQQLTRDSASYSYDFHPARLDVASFPTALWKKCFVEGVHLWSPETSEYSNSQGIWRLRLSLQSYLERSRGVLCEPEQIIITAGLQQSLDVVAHLLQDKHSTVAVEDPGYHLPRAVFSNHSFSISPIHVSQLGLDLDGLKASGSSIVYITPSHQLPMGYVMPVANRLNLIEWAQSEGNFILEDDYDSELRYQGKPIPSLHGLRPDGNIIYSGTFSKILSPALRISYLVLPKSLLNEYHRIFLGYFSTVSALEQLTLAAFIEKGHWDRHVRRMRILYRKKHDALLAAIEHHFGGKCQVIGQGAGLHVVLQLPTCKLTEMECIEKAQLEGIQLLPFSLFYAGEDPGPLKLILGFGGMKSSDLESGIALLARLFHTYL
jgi:GntR family transcriptional regulator / MocR family aminotransferase